MNRFLTTSRRSAAAPSVYPSTSFRLKSFVDEEFADRARRAHFQRSLKMTLITLALGMAFFALFFGLVAACKQL